VTECGVGHGGHQDGLTSTVGEALAFLQADPVVFDGGIPIPCRIQAHHVGGNFFRLDFALCREKMLNDGARHDPAVAQSCAELLVVSCQHGQVCILVRHGIVVRVVACRSLKGR
jgi:hypothetical protein